MIHGLSQLGCDLRAFVDPNRTDKSEFQDLQNAVDKSQAHNAWLTPTNTLIALGAWGDLLQPEALEEWLSNYSFEKDPDSTVGIVMAGNLPLVGFHDLLCVLISGHKAAIKLSSKDAFLIPVLVDRMTKQLPKWKGKVIFCENQLKGYDKVIATGSNNSGRYFEYYFRDKPHIVRKNRSSLAVLTGTETEEDLKGLAQDITLYFGLGCRSVSKILVPKDYDFDPLFNALYEAKDCINHHAYANNYDYNRAIFLMGEANMLDNGFLLVKQDSRLASPVGCLYFDYYDNIEQAEDYVSEISSDIQCVVGNIDKITTVPFGSAQYPKLSDYADGVDTLSFLLKN
ncbi:MAG: acyl-CoA reductase [Flavobacteriaceae bacterium]